MKLAIVFPGQGSQSPGMLAELAQQHEVVGQTFSEASDKLGYDLWELSQSGSEDQLKQTEITQPLMFVSGMAVWRIWQQQNLPAPAFVAGHSLGEYAALTAAGVFEFSDAVGLVALRGQLMADAVAPGVGGMAALLGMDDAAVSALCEELTAPDGIVEAVNFNSPGQVVISGHLAALENACTVARDKGARKAMVLPVSVPNHSSLMAPVEEPLAAAIDAANPAPAQIEVVQNAGASVPAGSAELISSLKKHVVSPVQWTESVRYIAQQGVSAIVELGPGKVLAGLCKRIDRSLQALPVESPATLQKTIDSIAVEQA
jgi:[acyl-carrier-protein] S-malonyltransferase